MLDIPKLGVPLLNDAIHHFARDCEDADDFEAGLASLETCKALTMKTTLKQGIRETSRSSEEEVQREKAVQQAVIETVIVRRMGR